MNDKLDFSSAIDDFRRARRQAALEDIMARLTGKSARLLSFKEVRQKLRAQEGKSQELREIPLEAIVGSVGRYSDFTRSFLPRRDSDAERWARVEMAAADLKRLPPILVYQVGQVYFVDDGHHRVSVARRLGATKIRAYVTPVHTKVPLAPDVQPDELILKAEYAEFLEHTHLDELRPGADLSVTSPGQYQLLWEHIQVHGCLMNLDQTETYKAAAHWYDQVYLPVVQVIRGRGILRDFPGRTETDLYVWISEHRAALEQELGWTVRPEAAAADLTARSSARPQRVLARVGEKILGAARPPQFEAGPPPGEWRKKYPAVGQADRLFADILVPVSGEKVGWYALEQALELARREGGQLRGLHIVPSPAHLHSQQVQAIQAEFSRRCNAANIPGELTVEVGKIAPKICERARWTDLVVVNLAHPPAPRPFVKLRSGFRNLIYRCPTPVLAVPRVSPTMERALLAYDGSPKAEEALFVATYLACRWKIHVTVVTVMEVGRTTPRALTRAQDYLEAHDVQAAFVKERGPVAQAILKTARERESDVIIMGGYGVRPELEVVLGSAVNQVLRHSQQLVLMCR